MVSCSMSFKSIGQRNNFIMQVSWEEDIEVQPKDSLYGTSSLYYNSTLGARKPTIKKNFVTSYQPPVPPPVKSRDSFDFIIGDCVWVDGYKRARVTYIGQTQFGKGEWIGLAFDKPYGTHDGSVHGVRYFQCQTLRGAFVRKNRITLYKVGPMDDEPRGHSYRQCLLERPSSPTRSFSSGSSQRSSISPSPSRDIPSPTGSNRSSFGRYY